MRRKSEIVSSFWFVEKIQKHEIVFLTRERKQESKKGKLISILPSERHLVKRRALLDLVFEGVSL